MPFQEFFFAQCALAQENPDGKSKYVPTADQPATPSEKTPAGVVPARKS